MTLARPMLPPGDPTRRRFLSQAAGGGRRWHRLGAVDNSARVGPAAPEGLLDPVFSLIEAHRTARAAYLVALAE